MPGMSYWADLRSEETDYEYPLVLEDLVIFSAAAKKITNNVYS